MLPHSDASEERVFSMGKKSKAPFRASMGFNNLRSIKVKLTNQNPAYFKAEKALVKSVKAQLGNIIKDTHLSHQPLP